MKSQRDRITDKLDQVGGHWAQSDWPYVLVSDPYPRPLYHVMFGEEQIRFSSLNKLEDYLDTLQKLAFGEDEDLEALLERLKL